MLFLGKPHAAVSSCLARGNLAASTGASPWAVGVATAAVAWQGVPVGTGAAAPAVERGAAAAAAASAVAAAAPPRRAHPDSHLPHWPLDTCPGARRGCRSPPGQRHGQRPRCGSALPHPRPAWLGGPCCRQDQQPVPWGCQPQRQWPRLGLQGAAKSRGKGAGGCQLERLQTPAARAAAAGGCTRARAWHLFQATILHPGSLTSRVGHKQGQEPCLVQAARHLARQVEAEGDAVRVGRGRRRYKRPARARQGGQGLRRGERRPWRWHTGRGPRHGTWRRRCRRRRRGVWRRWAGSGWCGRRRRCRRGRGRRRRGRRRGGRRRRRRPQHCGRIEGRETRLEAGGNVSDGLRATIHSIWKVPSSIIRVAMEAAPLPALCASPTPDSMLCRSSVAFCSWRLQGQVSSLVQAGASPAGKLIGLGWVGLGLWVGGEMGMGVLGEGVAGEGAPLA